MEALLARLPVEIHESVLELLHKVLDVHAKLVVKRDLAHSYGYHSTLGAGEPE